MHKHLRSKLRNHKFFVHAYLSWIGLRLLLCRFRSRRPLLVLMRSGGLGDIVASIPSINALRRQYPNHHLIYVTHPAFNEIEQLGLAVDSVIVSYHGDALMGLLHKFCDARSLKYLDELPGQISTRNFVLEMAESVGADLQGQDQPQIDVAPISDMEFESWFGQSRHGKRLLAIHTGPTAPVREWPLERWAELCQSFKNSDWLIVNIGIGRHFLHGSKKEAVELPALRPLRQLTILESARLLKTCELMIGVDSGPLHLSAAVGTRCIGLFGPVNPKLRAPANAIAVTAAPLLSCQFCHHQIPRGHWTTGCPENMACMEAIALKQICISY